MGNLCIMYYTLSMLQTCEQCNKEYIINGNNYKNYIFNNEIICNRCRLDNLVLINKDTEFSI
jgi:hypothetical protein